MFVTPSLYFIQWPKVTDQLQSCLLLLLPDSLCCIPLTAFPCKLLQTFKCAHNTLTPDFQRSYPGRLFITEQHVCFHVEDVERRTPVRGRESSGPFRSSHTFLERLIQELQKRWMNAHAHTRHLSPPPADTCPSGSGRLCWSTLP